jgi:hypothetical protein
MDPGSRNRQKGTDKIATGNKRMGIQVMSKVTRTLSRQVNEILTTETRKSLHTKKVVCNVHGGLAQSGSSCLCGYIQVMEKPTKSEDTAVGGKKRISAVKLGSKATETEGTQARIEDDISQSNGQKKLEQRTVSIPKDSNGRV